MEGAGGGSRYHPITQNHSPVPRNLSPRHHRTTVPGAESMQSAPVMRNHSPAPNISPSRRHRTTVPGAESMQSAPVVRNPVPRNPSPRHHRTTVPGAEVMQSAPVVGGPRTPQAGTPVKVMFPNAARLPRPLATAPPAAPPPGARAPALGTWSASSREPAALYGTPSEKNLTTTRRTEAGQISSHDGRGSPRFPVRSTIGSTGTQGGYVSRRDGSSHATIHPMQQGATSPSVTCRRGTGSTHTPPHGREASEAVPPSTLFHSTALPDFLVQGCLGQAL